MLFDNWVKYPSASCAFSQSLPTTYATQMVRHNNFWHMKYDGTVLDTHKFPLDARIRIASHARIRIASHRMRGNARMCEHSHRMCEMRAFAEMHAYVRIRMACAHMRAFASHARIRIACAEMRALRRVSEIAGMTPAPVFWCQTPETGFVVVRCIHKYWA